MRKGILVLTLALFTSSLMAQTYNVGLAGNSYITEDNSDSRIGKNGLESWNSSKSVTSTYISVQEAGSFDLSIEAKGNATIEISSGKTSYTVSVNSDDFSTIKVGKFTAKEAGYLNIDIVGVDETTNNFYQVKYFVIENLKGEVTYVNSFSDYWGRRGPSVHMGYELPYEDVEWFYNELTVPKNGEVMHSYYMAAGFGEGYFGIQYNSDTERRVLFSVWSPFDTQDPKSIPEDEKIELLKKGRDVHVGEFGNEGSGGQSYLKYNWKAGETYKFLMQVRPDGEGSTVYTAYFFATDDEEWRLVASFKRPKTNTWYKRPHSFLENFSPEQGYLTRSVKFANQWSCSKDGVWTRLTKGTFTHDATASAGVRSDYQGGVTKGGDFYLKMGGFFNESTKGNTYFKSTEKGEQPTIDLKSLESIE